jgi:hypothetical protein
MLALALALALAGAALATAARAGSYHLYSCRTPAGESAPADGWVGSKTGTYTYAEDTCQTTGGALIAALGDQAARTANTDDASWAFGAPAGVRIAGATLWRAGDADGGAAINATYEFWFAGPSNLNTPADAFGQCVAGVTCPSGVGNVAEPQSAENRLVVPAQNLGSQLFMNATCSGESGFKCKEGQADPRGYAAVVYLYAADMTLEQAAGPSASGVGGELASAAAVSGTSDVVFTASDPGSGVYEALFSVDGALVQAAALDENGGRCRNVGQTGDGLPAFLYAQPCLGTVSADAALDTTRLANGTHHLVVTVIDAAGNAAPVLDRNIVIANPTATAGSAAAGGSTTGGGQAGSAGAGSEGPANGIGASQQASLTVAWKAAKGARLVTVFGRTETITGRLTTATGAPIAGAQVVLRPTPAYAGAAAVSMASPRTGSDGRFTVRIPPGASSRALAFAYRSHLGDPLPVATRTLTLTVRAALNLSISPRTASVGRRIGFSGRLLGGPVPSTGKLLVLEARSGRGSWIKFDVARSDRRGRYRASYRFRFPGPARYEFRVISEAEGDYPYAAGSSNTVGVRER